MKDCLFCKIVSGEIPCVKIWEDEDSLAFLDINPASDGHTLLIPKEHYKNMEETPKDLLAKLFINAQGLMPKLRKSLDADFVAVSVVGNDVPHFHIHLVPRKFDDGLAEFWPTKNYPEGEDIKIAEKIREETAND
jgi:histidine triad (HIT) family protein